MNDAKSYVPPFQIGQAMEGGALGEVVESCFDGLAVGDVVLSNYGWRDGFVASGKELRKVDKPMSAYLGALGMTGMTAWAGLRIAEAKAGDVVFVSGAAGAVGGVAGQIAKQRGCSVIGSAGSAAKVKLLTEELGFDAAFNYHEGLDQLAKLAPDGIDVYFDNVGGDHLQAALDALRPHGRIALCGAISRYNASTPPAGPTNLALMIGKRLTMTGFIVSDWASHTEEFLQEAGGYLATGKLKLKETVVEGIENAPRAFIDMLAGGNVGKMLVKI
jgi:NADPH-dependent curcumin reductase CurA